MVVKCVHSYSVHYESCFCCKVTVYRILSVHIKASGDFVIISELMSTKCVIKRHCILRFLKYNKFIALHYIRIWNHFAIGKKNWIRVWNFELSYFESLKWLKRWILIQGSLINFTVHSQRWLNLALMFS